MKKFIILILILIFFIEGCTTTSRGSGSPNGVQINFIPNFPPSTVFEGDKISVGLELANYAECSANGVICIKQLLSNAGGIQEECKPLNLAPISFENKRTTIDKQKMYFTESNAYTGLSRIQQETSISATAVYKCNIVTGPEKICAIPVTTESEEPCPIYESISGNQLGALSAPVTVTKVEKFLSPSEGGVKLRAAITLKKMSKGRVIGEGALQNPFKLEEKESVVNIQVEYGGYGNMECKDERGPIENMIKWKSTEPEKIINCEILLNINDLTINPINVRMDYVYKITESKPITIRKSSQNA